MSELEQGTYIVKGEDNLGLFKKYMYSLAYTYQRITLCLQWYLIISVVGSPSAYGVFIG